ncbi:MAG: hypothetical protein ACM3JG_02385 [Thiohalocapsa sp.]
MNAFTIGATGATPAAAALAADRGWRRLRRRLSALAYRAAERITLPYRDLPPEFFRYAPY